MKKSSILGLILFFHFVLFSFAHVCWAENDEVQNVPYKISSIKAYLYFDQKGTLSENIIDSPQYPSGSLWNTTIGAGSAGSPSSAVLVIVEIIGKPREFDPKNKIDFLAIEKHKVKLKKLLSIRALNDEGRYFAAFWLYDTGCAPIVLSANIAGQLVDSKQEKKIDFQCGE